MLYSYFRLKDKHFKTLKLIKKSLNSKSNNLPKRKKINGLNEYQYFYLLNDLINHYPIEKFTVNELELFFKTNKVILNYSPSVFSDNEVVDEFVPVYADFVSLNYKKNVYSVVDYFFETKEYPQETLLTKLLVLSDKIFELIFDPLLNIRSCVDSYLETNKGSEDEEKLLFLIEISLSLQNHERNVLELIDKIQNKIESLSKNSIQKESYLIDTDDRVLKKLYFGLEKFMYLDQNKTSLSQFIEVLKFDWQSHESIIYLQMDNIQFKYFIECLSQFLNIKIPLTFIERSQNIRNINGVIKASSIRSSYSRAYGVNKDFETLRLIFESL